MIRKLKFMRHGVIEPVAALQAPTPSRRDHDGEMAELEERRHSLRCRRAERSLVPTACYGLVVAAVAGYAERFDRVSAREKHHGIEIIPSNLDEGLGRSFPALSDIPEYAQLIYELHSSMARFIFAALQTVQHIFVAIEIRQL